MEPQVQQQQQQQQDHRRDTNYEDLSEDLNRARESEYLDLVCKLRTELDQKSDDCEVLKIKLADCSNELESLGQELNQCKLTIFENTEDTRKANEEMIKSKKIEEDYVKLMSDFLELNERCEQYRFNLNDKYIEKSNAINNLECLMSSGALQTELTDCRTTVHAKTSELILTNAKIRHLEEDVITKEKCITELRKTIDDAKVTHKHEITVLDEYIHSLKNTISSYEKTLADYTEQPKPQEENLAAIGQNENNASKD